MKETQHKLKRYLVFLLGLFVNSLGVALITKAEHLLQIPVSLVFGYFIDLCMLLLFFVQPAAYVLKILYLLVGCIVLGIGVYMEVLANVIMLPGEAFVRAVVFRWKTEFGVTKVAFDVSMAVIAGVLGIDLTIGASAALVAVPTGCCGIIRAVSASFCTRRSITASARSCSANI